MKHSQEIVALNKDPNNFVYYTADFKTETMNPRNTRSFIKQIVEADTPMTPEFIEIIKRYNPIMLEKAKKLPTMKNFNTELTGQAKKRFQTLMSTKNVKNSEAKIDPVEPDKKKYKEIQKPPVPPFDPNKNYEDDAVSSLSSGEESLVGSDKSVLSDTGSYSKHVTNDIISKQGTEFLGPRPTEKNERLKNYSEVNEELLKLVAAGQLTEGGYMEITKKHNNLTEILKKEERISNTERLRNRYEGLNQDDLIKAVQNLSLQPTENKVLNDALEKLELSVVEKQISDKIEEVKATPEGMPVLVKESVINPFVVNIEKQHGAERPYDPVEVKKELSNKPKGAENSLGNDGPSPEPQPEQFNGGEGMEIVDDLVGEETKKLLPFAVKEIAGHSPKYHLNSILFYFGNITKPEWDIELENNVFSSKMSKSEIILNSESVIKNFGSILFIHARKSDTIEEFNELIQLQFCYLRNLARGARSKMAMVPISSLTSFANKLNGVNPAEEQPRNDYVEPLESASEMGDPTTENQPPQQQQQQQQGESIQVQISPNEAQNAVVNAYRNRPFELFNKPIFNKQIQQMTTRHNKTYVGANSGKDTFNLFS